MRCNFAHCPHGGEIKGNKYVTIKKKHYHKDCAKMRNELAYIRNLWRDRIDKHVYMSQLNKCLNDLIFDKGYSIEYVTFTIEYALDNHMNLNFPGGIKYFLKNPTIKKAYDIKKTSAQSVKLENYLKSAAANKPLEKVEFKKKKKTSLLEELFGDGV